MSPAAIPGYCDPIPERTKHKRGRLTGLAAIRTVVEVMLVLLSNETMADASRD